MNIKKDKDRSATPASAPVGSQTQGKNRKEMYGDQLPLQPGRRVAFKVPAGGGGEEEEWILVTIRKCLGDKVKYEVVDADDNKT
jgi:SAGA-associated factor 29